MVSGAYALPLAALGGGYYIWKLRNDTPPGVDIKSEVTSIAIAGAGVAVYGIIALSVGGYRNFQLQRWARRHRVVALPQGDGLLMGGSLALFSAVPLIPLGLSLLNSSNALGVTMLATTIAASAIGGPIMLGIGGRRLRHYHDGGGWRRRAPSFVGRGTGLSIPAIQPSILPAARGVTVGVAGQF
ncbi:hypothetical protein ENSA7_77880 [Enhygromyxa salina]|uniref:Uncharacterized protein n=1 Tax=Enhygromyxa salina TaxID=215803 RepID=A0A2S9XNJ8_9BACT|nr:hypothetical protein ENSA7_77880 [Enhygromyxa salina]